MADYENIDLTILSLDDAASLDRHAYVLETVHGFDVLTASDLETGKELIETSRIDCVLGECTLLARRDFELVRWIREEQPELPVVLFANPDSDPPVDAAVEAGVTRCVTTAAFENAYWPLARHVEQLVSQSRTEDITDPDEGIVIEPIGSDASSRGTNELVVRDRAETNGILRSVATKLSPTVSGRLTRLLDRILGPVYHSRLRTGSSSADGSSTPSEPSDERSGGSTETNDGPPTSDDDTAESDAAFQLARSAIEAAESGEIDVEKSAPTDAGEPEPIESEGTGSTADTESGGELEGRPDDSLPLSSAVPTHTESTEGDTADSTRTAADSIGSTVALSSADRGEIEQLLAHERDETDRDNDDPDRLEQLSKDELLVLLRDHLEEDAADESEDQATDDPESDTDELESDIDDLRDDIGGFEDVTADETASREPDPDPDAADSADAVGQSADSSDPATSPDEPNADSADALFGTPDAYHRPDSLDLEHGTSVLVQCGSHDDRKTACCTDLLGLDDVTDSHVLLIRYTQIDGKRLERIASDAARVKIISIGYSQPIPDPIQGTVENVRINNPNDVTRLGIVVTGTVDEWATSGVADIVVCYDPLDVLLQYKSVQGTFRFLHLFLSKLQTVDAVSHFHVDPSAGDPHEINTLKPLFDRVITIDSVGTSLESE
ncbi:response regulator [Natrarchaeobius halalkaliphilus]|uniref:Response regulator n=1 Tax=Natrarchaeobius halalkaliphilus TaxID=1679091 RepID=A0A3N6LMT3_9EURY|nr:response regulator [Natrarchaeobius halalkaliphilus]RQG89167.1 response regulator [Natrarchaeobius halalkaliphilus]